MFVCEDYLADFSIVNLCLPQILFQSSDSLLHVTKDRRLDSNRCSILTKLQIGHNVTKCKHVTGE